MERLEKPKVKLPIIIKIGDRKIYLGKQTIKPKKVNWKKLSEAFERVARAGGLPSSDD